MLFADAHADSLMWNRDLNAESKKGHLDFPRLRRAGVTLQCFTVVTRGFPYVGGFPLFALSRGWGGQALKGPWSRALFQLEQMRRAVAASGATVRVAERSAALRMNREAGALSAVLGLEGAQALEGKLTRVEEVHRLGVRFMSLTHLSNNALGGSSFPGMGDRGLTPFGREVVEEMGRLGMSVDVAHASRRTLRELLELGGPRPFCSHSGVEGARALWRNLPDQALRSIADRGGVVGIIFAPPYLGGSELDDWVRHVEHALSVMGEEGVALGSDFDGMVPLPRGMRDVTDLPLLVQALRRRGHPEGRIEKVMGLNLLRFFEETLG